MVTNFVKSSFCKILNYQFSGHCTQCKKGYSGFTDPAGKQTCYTFVSNGYKISLAGAVCKAMGAKLPLPTNVDENMNLFNFARTKGLT